MERDRLYQQVGEQVKMVRETTGDNQQEFAKKIDVTPGHLCDIEKGRTPPSMKLLKVIALKTQTTVGIVFIKK